MGADYSIELISIETYAPQFIGHNKIFLGSVYYLSTNIYLTNSHIQVFYYLPTLLAYTQKYKFEHKF
jgi:hypothetical protein